METKPETGFNSHASERPKPTLQEPEIRRSSAYGTRALLARADKPGSARRVAVSLGLD